MNINELLTQFVAEYINKTGVGNTPQNKGQCTGLVSLFMDILKVPHEFGNAKDLLTNASQSYFEITYNNPKDLNQFPLPGDIMVFDGTWGNGFGHTGLVVSATGSDFRLFEQNDITNQDLNGACEVLMHDNYNGVAGWLHFKGGVTMDQNTINAQKAHLFDLIWIHRFGQINTNDATEAEVNDFNTWLDSNVKRGGMWDQLCQDLGFTGDSNQITVNQILAKVTDQTATKKLTEIKTIVNG